MSTTTITTAASDLQGFSPTNNSNSTSKFTEKKYTYHFGIDSIELSEIHVEDNMCFISEDIEIGELAEDEYIQLVSSYDTGDNGSVEFYILDGSEPKPILPIDTSVVINEKVFFGLRPRFAIDTDHDVVIKKDGSTVDTSLDQAIDSNKDGYTVSYTPLDAHDLTIKNHSIRVKAILRTYDKNAEAPYIKNIAIKKYGRSTAWERITSQ